MLDFESLIKCAIFLLMFEAKLIVQEDVHVIVPAVVNSFAWVLLQVSWLALGEVPRKLDAGHGVLWVKWALNIGIIKASHLKISCLKSNLYKVYILQSFKLS
jgi:hypothetical protein